MVFCNSSETCKYVFNLLEKKRLKATYVTSDLMAKKVPLVVSIIFVDLKLFSF